MATKGTTEVLTSSELQQCYYGVEFALKDFRRMREGGQLQVVMSTVEMDKTEANMRQLKDKLIRMEQASK